MSSTGLAERLDAIHAQILAGSRVASRDLFLEAQEPLAGYIARTQPSLDADDAHDIATDALLKYLDDPMRCSTQRASLWTYLCMVVSADAIDLFRTRARRLELLGLVADDVEDWSRHANHSVDPNVQLDAHRILERHGHKLVTNASERNVLRLMLMGEKSTGPFAQVLGLDPNDAEAEGFVKQAKDRLRLRMRRLRDEL